MGFSDQLGSIYTGLEDKFYAGMDFLSDHGIPVYALIDPLEERGIPAFPVAIAALIALLFLAYGLLFLTNSETTLQLSITDETGKTLSGVAIIFKDEASEKRIEMGSNTFRDGQEVKVLRGIGSRLVLEASKEGYESATRRLPISKQEMNVAIQLKRFVIYTEGALRLVDSETGDLIEGARLRAALSDQASIDCFEGARGIYTCPGIVFDEDITLTIDHPNYEQKTFETTFLSDSVGEIELVPKASASTGKTNLIVRAFDFDNQQRIGNFTLKVFDAQDNEIITELTETDNDGEQITKISKGTSIRVVVEKEGYLTYDSSVLEENITLRNDEAIREVYLKPGQNALTVGVLDVTGRPLISIDVFLYNEFGELLDVKTTSLAGQIAFENLDVTSTYYVSAWSENYVPAREEVLLSERNNVNLVLERATADNSGSLTVYTVDEQSNAVNDATLNFFEDVEGKGLIPLGVPPQKTDATGKYSMLAPLNSTLVIEATKSGLEGQETVSIIGTFDNKAIITLLRPFSQVNLTVLDEQGNEIREGLVTIIAGDDLLFEDEYEQGGIVFDPKDNSYVTVKVTDGLGNSFEEEIFVEGLDEVSVSPQGKTGVSTNPEVEFLGVYNIDGSEANGLAKGVDFYLKFRIVFPEGKNENGLHVRLGEESVRFVDSQDAGIIGFSASEGKAFYGRSYSPEPSPGFEALDFDNVGSEGKFNKFIELYFSDGGEKIVKVRAKAKETASLPDILLSYRAWSRIGETIYRTPQDPELGTEVFSSGKTSLYAETKRDRIKILEASASCKNDLCASYQFVRSDGSEFSTENFVAIIGELYALEVNLSPELSSEISVKASTQKQKPKIGFQGFGINDYANFPDNNSHDTSVQVDNISALDMETTSVRLFFKPYKTENATIILQLISGETVINEQFHFEVYEEKNLVLNTIPETVSLGEDFVIVIKDEDNKAIEDAEIILSNSKGEHLETIQGKGSANNGSRGRYSVKNSFDAGVINYEINVPKYKPLRGAIEITKQGVLTFSEDESYVMIRRGQTSAEKFLEINNTSRQAVNELSFEIKPVGSLPEGLHINVTPLSILAPSASQRIIVTAEYTGDRENAHGEVMLIARGRTETGYTVSAETKLIVDFNPSIDRDCVEFSKNKLAVYVASGLEDRSYYDSVYGTLPQTEPTNYYRYNNFTTSTSVTFTAKLADKSECQGLELELLPKVIPEGKKNEGLEVESEMIKLFPMLSPTEGRRSDVDDITVTISNNIVRNYSGKEKFNFDLVYRSEDFEKSIPLEVYIWNPRYALQVTRNIELFLGPDNQGRLSAQVPLFVRNVGEADIEDVRFLPRDTKGTGNVDIRVEPNFPIQFLKKGQAILPPKTLVAQVTRTEKTTLLEIKELDIMGVIDGQTFNFGPVIITAHASADQCLIASPSTLPYFSTKSSEGALSKEITLKNTCAEEVRIVGLSEAPLGNNNLNLSPVNSFIPPGASSKFNLILEKREDYQGSPVPVYLKGFLPRSGNSIDSTPIYVNVKIGKEIDAGKAASETVKVPVCESDEEKDVRFPIIASGTNPQCDNAYCDAVQLSSYLTDKVEQKIKDAEKQIQNLSGTVANSSCDQGQMARGFCNFDNLGLSNETFVVYMSHDNLTPELLHKEFATRSGSIKNYTSDYTQRDFAGELLGGYSKQVFLNDNLRGCGKYHVTLNGAARIQGNRIMPDLMNIVIDVTPNEDDNAPVRQITEQCMPRIQNIGNFLPQDEGIDVQLVARPWLGMVQAEDASLEEVSKDVAKKLFGSEDRASKSIGSTNTLKLSYDTQPGYLVKVEMDKVASSNPVTINAYIREAIGTEETLQSEIAKEAADAIAGLKNNAIDGCISEDESYFQLKSKKDLGSIELKVDGEIPVLYKSVQCAELEISSKVKERVALGRDSQPVQVSGITSESPFYFEAENDNRISELVVDKLNEKTNRFTANARVCVEGDSEMHKAHDKNVVVSIQRIEGEGKKPIEQEVGLKVCGVHPLEFVEKLSELEPDKDDYYATFVWNDEPDAELTIENFRKLELANNTLNKANQVLDGTTAIQKGDSDPVVKAKQKAANYYLGACAATSAATGFFRMGIAGLLFSAVLDCGVPYMALVGKDVPILGDIIKYASDLLEPIKNAVGGALDYIGGTVKKLFSWLGVGAIEDAGAAVEGAELDDVQNNIIDAFVPASLIKDSVLAETKTYGMKRINATQIKSISENIAKDIANKFDDSVFRESTGFGSDLRRQLSTNIRTDLTEAMKQKKIIGGKFLTRDELGKTINGAIEKTGKDSALLGEFYSQRAGISSTSPIKVTEIADDVLEDISKGMNLGKHATDQSVRVSKAAIADPTRLAKEIDLDVTASLRQKAISSYKQAIGFNGRIPSTITRELNNITLDAVEDAAKGTAKVSAAVKGNALQEMEEVLLRYSRGALENGKGTTKIVNALEKKFSAKSASRIAGTAVDAFDVGKARPGFFSFRSTGKFLGNALKEGAFGLLANWVGLKTYDYMLDKELEKLEKGGYLTTERKEVNEKQLDFFGPQFELEKTTEKILNFRTYRISVDTQADQSRKFTLGFVDSIPKDAEHLNNCKNPNFEEGIGGSFPGLVPEVENEGRFPEPFRESQTLKQQHVRIAKNYLTKQANGDRYGGLITSAVNANENKRKEFELVSSLNLEALVTSIGIMKSGLGTDASLNNRFMFGCAKSDTSQSAPYENALCAVNTIISYQGDECNADVKNIDCYFNNYKSDSNNAPRNFIGFDSTEFGQVYEAWESYELGISVLS